MKADNGGIVIGFHRLWWEHWGIGGSNQASVVVLIKCGKRIKEEIDDETSENIDRKRPVRAQEQNE